MTVTETYGGLTATVECDEREVLAVRRWLALVLRARTRLEAEDELRALARWGCLEVAG